MSAREHPLFRRPDLTHAPLIAAVLAEHSLDDGSAVCGRSLVLPQRIV